MNPILSGTLNSLDQFNAGQKQQLYESSHMNLAAVSREQSADITFVTKEGDKVTLSADSSFEAAYATYDSQARVNGAYTESRGRLNSVNFEREITISVEGDLNDEEKKEIKTDAYLNLEPDARKMRKLVRRITVGLFHQLENLSNIAKDHNHSENPAKVAA